MNRLSALNNLDRSWRGVQQLIDELLVLGLLSSQVLNRCLQLIEGVLQSEQVVQIKWEIELPLLIRIVCRCLYVSSIFHSVFFRTVLKILVFYSYD